MHVYICIHTTTHAYAHESQFNKELMRATHTHTHRVTIQNTGVGVRYVFIYFRSSIFIYISSFIYPINS